MEDEVDKMNEEKLGDEVNEEKDEDKNDKNYREEEENEEVIDENKKEENDGEEENEEDEESEDPELFIADNDNEIGELQICHYSSLTLISITCFYNRIDSLLICDNDKLKSIYLEESFVSAIKVEITSKH